MQTFSAALDRRRDHFWAQYFKALCHFKLATGRPDQARQYRGAIDEGLTTCIAQRADFVWSYILRGYARVELDDAEGGERDFGAALALLARKPDRFAEYALYVNRGTLRGLRGSPDNAEKDLRHAIGLQPGQFAAHLNLGRVYEAQRKLDAALAEFDRAVALAPGRADLHRRRAGLQVRRQQGEQALADFNEAVRLAGALRTREVAIDHVERANLLRGQKKLKEALEACDRAVFADRTLGEAYRMRGELLLEKGDLAEAALALDVYVLIGRRDPKSAPPRASVHRARAAARAAQRVEDALADYTRALELEPDLATYAARGWLYAANDAFKFALADFAHAVAGGHADGFAGRGYVRVQRGDLTGGVADAEEGLRRSKEGWRVTYHAAQVYAQAAGRAERDPRRALYETKAADLVGRALALQPTPAARAAFWKNFVLKDSALDPVRRSAPFKRLVRDRQGTGR